MTAWPAAAMCSGRLFIDIRDAAPDAGENDMKSRKLSFTLGIRTALADGTLVSPSPGHMATEVLYAALPGAKLCLQSEIYLFAPAEYAPERDEKYLYTYAYQKESNWTSYKRNLTPDSYRDQEYVFRESCFFRVCVKRKDGAVLQPEDQEEAERSLLYYPVEEENPVKPWFEEEIEDTVRKLDSGRTEGREDIGAPKLFCLLSDSHYTVNGTWEDTARNIRRVHERVRFDAVIHLGDLTDGVTSARATRHYANRVLRDLRSLGIPVYVAVGNHDTNYFLGNREVLREEELAEIYRAEEDAASYYYVDMEGVRCLFLSSFDSAEPIRYGFPAEELEWLRKTLYSTPAGKSILVFSHNAPLAELDYWSCRIRNGEELLDILEEYQEGEGRHVLAYFYGHTHADAVYRKCSFPLVSIGCAKCEHIQYNKPAGSYTPPRRPDTASQELWDAMDIDYVGKKIRLVRFGAGEDRVIDCRKGISGWRQDRRERKERRPVKIWAHRGASGHAPENTMPAFRLAAEMDVDGVELDVQMTRDGELVVIHDERIDRVSDGAGFVRDYTLEELKKYNFNKTMPAWGRVEIPTLREVYGLLRDKDIFINLELKNSVWPYEGLEKAVCELAAEMGMGDRILYSSFQHASMCRIKEIEPEARVAFLYSDGFLDMPSYARRFGAWAVHPGVGSLRFQGAELGKECRERGVRLHVWTVNTQEDLKLASEAGANAVITNYPDRIAGYLEEKM